MLVKCGIHESNVSSLSSQMRDISQPAGVKTTEDKVTEFISRLPEVNIECGSTEECVTTLVGRKHRLTSSKRVSAKSETFASSRLKNELEKKRPAKKQIAIQSKKKPPAREEKGYKKKLRLEGESLTEAENTEHHFCRIFR